MTEAICMEDITTQWQKPIYTKDLHESPIAYKTFRIRCLHPSWTNRQLAENAKQPFDTVERWSYKYYHQTRLQAYLDECYDVLDSQKIEIIQNDFQSRLNRQSKDHQLSEKLQRLAEHDIDNAIKMIDKGQPLTDKQYQNITTSTHNYQDQTKASNKDTYDVLRSAKENIDPDRYNTEDIPVGAKQFIQILKEGRNEYDNK